VIEMKDVTKGLGILVMIILTIAFVVFFMINMFFTLDSETILIEGIDGVKVISGDFVLIDSNGSYYKVKLNEREIDFTVNSEIYIEVKQYLMRSWFWEDFEPQYDYYFINRIIKVPET